MNDNFTFPYRNIPPPFTKMLGQPFFHHNCKKVLTACTTWEVEIWKLKILQKILRVYNDSCRDGFLFFFLHGKKHFKNFSEMSFGVQLMASFLSIHFYLEFMYIKYRWEKSIKFPTCRSKFPDSSHSARISQFHFVSCRKNTGKTEKQQVFTREKQQVSHTGIVLWQQSSNSPKHTVLLLKTF